MNKIGILTLPPISNYGGILQNYALQVVLSSRGNECITLERRQKRTFVKDLMGHFKNYTYNRIRGNYYFKLSNFQKKLVYAEQSRFKEKYIVSSSILYSSSELKKYIQSENINIVIVGSDQVWRNDYTPFLSDMFFCSITSGDNIKKVAYAASFGKDSIDYSGENINAIKMSLQGFDLITVREESGVEICRKDLACQAKHVLDPTLLLSKDDYIRNLGLIDNPLAQAKGVYSYLLDSDVKKDELINFISGFYNCIDYKVQPKCFEGDVSKNIEDYKSPAIEEWLQGFLDARFVVTDSFHGTVFSILFNKQFYAIINKDKGASRFESLLKMFDLEDRLIDLSFLDMNQLDLNKEVDYNVVNQRLELLRTKSKELLFSIL
ncbi:polysaccharide pyruvyl transferase family protein [Myroides marinus]|uniref:polysaccharide pyruvyl transferase family protein n=1 Tax=Myroides marinus TaxID=703342 RepID=UPI0025774F20|nr:polysaccharide pyruvyl transferase family protein [Myroides marinus]MDM1405491.1 polysaccharide pyruvyl transferase family protein [Myroides marinus]